MSDLDTQLNVLRLRLWLFGQLHFSKDSVNFCSSKSKAALKYYLYHQRVSSHEIPSMFLALNRDQETCRLAVNVSTTTQTVHEFACLFVFVVVVDDDVVVVLVGFFPVVSCFAFVVAAFCCCCLLLLLLLCVFLLFLLFFVVVCLFVVGCVCFLCVCLLLLLLCVCFYVFCCVFFSVFFLFFLGWWWGGGWGGEGELFVILFSFLVFFSL